MQPALTRQTESSNLSRGTKERKGKKMKVGTLIWMGDNFSGWIHGTGLVIAVPASDYFRHLVAATGDSFAFYSFEQKSVLWMDVQASGFEIICEGPQ